MSDRFVGFGEPRAFACVIRDGENGPELLVFDHPIAGTQIPKGRIDDGESSESAAVRELTEESGLHLDASRFIGHLRQQFEHPATGETVEEDWYVWRFEARPGITESWTHFAEEENLEFAYRWIPLDGDTPEKVHPYFAEVVDITARASRSQPGEA